MRINAILILYIAIMSIVCMIAYGMVKSHLQTVQVHKSDRINQLVESCVRHKLPELTCLELAEDTFVK